MCHDYYVGIPEGELNPRWDLVRKIDAALDLSWLRIELAPHYSSTGRPSTDPELIIRMLIVGYVFAIRSERLICREVQVNLADRWFCKLGIEDAMTFFVGFWSGSSRRASRPVWSVAKALPSMRA